MTKCVHLIAALLAASCIAIFWGASVVVELFGAPSSIAAVKNFIVAPGLFVLIPAMALLGATGFVLSKDRKGRLLAAKKKRMPFIVLNGLLILLPSALLLDYWAAAGVFDAKFYVVQGLELIAGAVNLGLMGMNARDGIRMSGRIKFNQ